MFFEAIVNGQRTGIQRSESSGELKHYGQYLSFSLKKVQIPNSSEGQSAMPLWKDLHPRIIVCAYKKNPSRNKQEGHDGPISLTWYYEKILCLFDPVS